MLIVGYCLGAGSERRLCEEVHLNLTYRWFCGLSLDGEASRHATFSMNRHGRFRESDLAATAVRDRVAALHRRGPGRRRRFCCLFQLDPGRRQRPRSRRGGTSLLPEAPGRAVEEYFAVLDDSAFGTSSEVTPRLIAPADPAMHWTAAQH
jgi:hypothetical protein